MTVRPPLSAGAHRADFDLVVVGAGWSGLAAAVQACAEGARVALLDAAPQAGGRARRQTIDLGFGPLEVDNGQHLLIGAYRQTIDLLGRIGVDPATVFTREPMRLIDTEGLDMRAARLPAPAHLAWALLACRGLPIMARLALLGFMTRLRLAGWEVEPGETVACLLRRMRQPELLKRRIWEPLCISALNTLPERACARTFAAVLRESLGASRAASDFLLPRATLSDCLPDPAVAWLRARGAALHLRTPVRSLRRLVGTERSWRVDLHDGFLCARHVVLACGIAGTRRLLADLADEPDSRGPNPSIAQTLAALDTYTFEPIATIWTAWPSASWKTRPSPLMFAWATPENRLADWLFDRGEQRGHRIGAMVVSVAGEAHVIFPADAALARARDVCRAQGLPEPSHARSVIERRATFVCTPNRPIVTLPESGILPGLWLAGDYTEADFPATLEAAVRSGLSVGKLAGRIQDHSQARASA